MIMIVSNFELLVKRIATVNPDSGGISRVFRRVIQGYFLQVSNLEVSRSISLFIKITIPTSTGNREIIPSGPNGNVQIIFDNGTINNRFLTLTRLSSSNTSFTEYQTSSFTLNSRQTGLLTILPNVGLFFSEPNQPNQLNPDLEIRGYVELRQRRRGGFPSPFLFTPEANVLVSPETRGTFLDDDYPTNSTSNELDFDQIAYGLTIASGKGQNIVESVPLITFDVNVAGGLVDDIPQLRQLVRNENPDLEEDELDTFVNSLAAMKGNKEVQKLIDVINKKK